MRRYFSVWYSSEPVAIMDPSENTQKPSSLPFASRPVAS